MAKSSKMAARQGKSWKWINNYNCNNRGRLWLVWKVHDVDVDVLVTHEQFIHVKVHIIHNGNVFLVTFVYGLHSVRARRPLWQGLKHLAKCIEVRGLNQLKSVRPYYSRSNKGIGDVIWEKLKLVKKAVKQLHSQEFTSINSKIDKASDELTSIQQSLAHEPDLLELQKKEKICTLNLKKWLLIEESALRQKLGFNGLILGQKLEDIKDIREEFVKFYSSLLGSSSTKLESMDLPTLSGWNSVIYHGKFLISMAYKKLMGMHPKVYWRRIVCNNKASPRSLFVVWLMLSKKLVTVEILRKWHVQCDMLCVFCQSADKTIEHLFFGCQFTQDVWQRVLNKLGYKRNVTNHNNEIDYAVRSSRRKSDKAKVYCKLFAEYIYAIWLQTNNRRFARNQLDEIMLFRQILFRVACRCFNVQRQLLL
ncbi:hypothetical protein RDABS01_018300 [Bienertia sinuspersici]